MIASLFAELRSRDEPSSSEAESQGSRKPQTIDRWPDGAVLALWLAVAVGVVLRLRELLHNRSLWRDEASLVFNLRHRDILGFTTPLDHDQGTPPGFFVLAQTVGRALGGSETAYRTVPFVAACTALVVAAVLVRRRLPPIAGVVTLWLLAVSWTLIYYGAEVKQYGPDVAIMLLMLLVADEADRRSWSAMACAGFGVAGSLALLASYPSVFVLPVVGLAALCHARQDRRAIVRLLLVGSVWCATLGGSYFAWSRDLNDNDFLRRFWAEGFLPIPPASWADVRQWGRALDTLYAQTFPSRAVLLGVGLAAAGIVAVARRNRSLISLLLAPWLLVAVASSFELYPAIERSVLFLVPLLAVLIAAGVDALASALERHRPGAAILTTVLVCLLAAGPAVRDFLRPANLEEMRPLLASLRSHLVGSTVFVTESAEVTWDYYSDRLHLEPARVVVADFERHDEDGARAAARALIGEGEVWVFDAAFWEQRDVLDPAVRQAFDDSGTRIAARHEVGVSAYVYDLSR